MSQSSYAAAKASDQPTSAQLKELFSQIESGRVTKQSLQMFLRGNKDLLHIDWYLVYENLDMLNGYFEFKKTQSAAENLNLWTIPVIKGVTLNKVVETLRKLKVEVSPCIEDLDANVTKNDRDPINGSYTVSFKRTIEADEENKNLSANQIGHKGITLLERLLLELGYFLATGKHLDIENVTLCSGSRYSGGNVPRVDWSSGLRGVFIDWSYPDHDSSRLRSRSVVF